MLGELGLGVLEISELLLPAGLETASDQPVVGLAGVERALGADRLIAGALDTQLERAVRARPAVLVLVGGGERERDLVRDERRKQSLGDELIDDPGLDLSAAGGDQVLGAAEVGGGVEPRRDARDPALAQDQSPRRDPHASRPVGQSAHPPAAFASSALRSSSQATCSGVSLGSWPSRSAAAAETCGAANDVPLAWT